MHDSCFNFLDRSQVCFDSVLDLCFDFLDQNWVCFDFFDLCFDFLNRNRVCFNFMLDLKLLLDRGIPVAKSKYKFSPSAR